MPKKTAEILEELAESLKALTEEVKGIGDRVVKLEKPEDKKSEVEPTPKVVESSVENPLHRALVDEVLNKHFGFKVENDFSGTRLVILVPKKYSNASEAHWETYHEDARPSKPFLAHEIEVGFKGHLEKVLSNFNPDEKALVVNDR